MKSNRTRTSLITAGIAALITIFSALLTTATASEPTRASQSAITAPAKHKPTPVKPCRNKLAVTLKAAGFKGDNLHEAWAIAMRESHGHPKSISTTHDYGLFQFNRAAWSEQPWWNQKKLLTAEYNAKIAYRISKGGKTWYPWGLDGQGRANAHVYRNIGWSKDKISSHITQPYGKYYRAFNKLPNVCK